jgi:hypothetical protein
MRARLFLSFLLTLFVSNTRDSLSFYAAPDLASALTFSIFW